MSISTEAGAPSAMTVSPSRRATGPDWRRWTASGQPRGGGGRGVASAGPPPGPAPPPREPAAPRVGGAAEPPVDGHLLAHGGYTWLRAPPSVQTTWPVRYSAAS